MTETSTGISWLWGADSQCAQRPRAGRECGSLGDVWGITKVSLSGLALLTVSFAFLSRLPGMEHGLPRAHRPFLNPRVCRCPRGGRVSVEMLLISVNLYNRSSRKPRGAGMPEFQAVPAGLADMAGARPRVRGLSYSEVGVDQH